MRRFASLSLTVSVFSVALFAAAQFDAHAAAVAQPRTTASDAGLSLRLAQGSMGGTLGNREKSLSGSREAEPDRPARQSQPKESRRPAPARRNTGGGGGGNFDGAWTVVSVGCSGGGTGTVVVSSGRLVGQGVSGSISPNGTIRSVTNVGNGIRAIGSGRASGRRASGIYRQTDGCTGRFTAVKN